MDNFNIYAEVHHLLFRKTFPGWEIPERTIPDHELVLINSGQGSVTVNGTVFPVYPGILFHFAPGVLHSLSTDVEQPMSFYAVHFDAFYINAGKAPVFCHPNIKDVSTPPDFSVLKNIFKDMIDYKKNMSYGYELACNSLLGLLLYKILRGAKTDDLNYSALRKAENIIEYIDKNITRKITLLELASVFSLSPAYLSKFFKDATGYNVIEFINKLKMDKAKALIIEGGYKVKEISDYLGFDDPYYFSRVFKKTEGLSPSDYHKHYVNNR